MALVLLLSLLLVLAAVTQDDQRARAPALAVTFAHIDHQDQECVACHHNFVDDTGVGLCIDCHKRDPTVSHLAEAQFHALCQGCHITQQGLAEAHGPVRECAACHTPDPYP